MAAPGETDLARLLRGLEPVLVTPVYVFATLAPGQPVPPGLEPLALFREDEGTTLILERARADAAGLAHVFACRRITLTVHSSLAAVGLIAAVATALARAGIGTNPVSGYFHDHLFVAEADAERALTVLLEVVQRGTVP